MLTGIVREKGLARTETLKFRIYLGQADFQLSAVEEPRSSNHDCVVLCRQPDLLSPLLRHQIHLQHRLQQIVSHFTRHESQFHNVLNLLLIQISTRQETLEVLLALVVVRQLQQLQVVLVRRSLLLNQFICLLHVCGAKHRNRQKAHIFLFAIFYFKTLFNTTVHQFKVRIIEAGIL